MLEKKIRDDDDNGVAARHAIETSRASLKLVPRRRGWKQRISRMTRRTWRRPFLGGMNFSTSSVKRISPTLSLLRMAEKASTEAISAASSRLDCARGAEKPGAAHVHHQHEGQLAFLDELLDKRMVHPRRHVPIDGADFVARLVFAHLLEIHPLALEDAMVLAAQRLGHQPGGAQLDLPDFFENLARDHG